MAFLKVRSGSAKDQTFEIKADETILGRDPANPVTVDDPSVSAQHCAVLRDGQRFTLRDLKSTNGTRINDRRITESRLNVKDVISLGSVEIVFDGDDIEAYAHTPVSGPQRDAGPAVIASPATVSGIESGRFGARTDTKWIWRTVIAFLCVVALAALVWFFFRLFRG